ncbi:MAG: GEVED domain-containing protein, partial [Holophagales bacterium]|nr:GEVED domain-containing protein [Holophagales bacterium]
PQTVAPGSFYECSFTATVTASGSGEAGAVSASATATVTITDAVPTILVTKTASPTSIPEPGGSVTFTVRVENTSGSEPVTLTSLVDDIHGDLNGQGTCSMPRTIAAGGVYQCQLTATVSGNAGSSEVGTVTATASDDEGNSVQDSGSAAVTVTNVAPVLSVTKAADPSTLQEPGGGVTFTARVSNLGVSTDPLTLQSLVDDIHGDLNGQGSCGVPQTVAPGSFYECSFTATVTGVAGDSETDTVTATVQDDEGTPASGSDTATVWIEGTDYGDAPDPGYPTLRVSDGARHVLGSGLALGLLVDSDPDGQPDPSALGDDLDGIDDEDGLSFSALRAGSSGTVDVVTSGAGLLNAWIDFDSDGDWSGPGEQIFTDLPLSAGTNSGLSIAVPAGATLGTTFARFRFSTDSGLRPTGEASDGEVEDVVLEILEPLVSSIALVKTASPTSIEEPGGSVTFTVRVDNTGNTSVDITGLLDDIHGDLDGQGSCSMPQTVAVGGSYECGFTATVSGNAGESETDTVTASGSGEAGAV